MAVSGCVKSPALVRRRTSQRFVGSRRGGQAEESRPTSIKHDTFRGSRVRYAASPRDPSHGHIGFTIARFNAQQRDSRGEAIRLTAAAAIIWWGETLQPARRGGSRRIKLDERHLTENHRDRLPDCLKAAEPALSSVYNLF
jgi:hypothetical protein